MDFPENESASGSRNVDASEIRRGVELWSKVEPNSVKSASEKSREAIKGLFDDYESSEKSSSDPKQSSEV
jgi:hypothetical protein